MSVGTPRCGRKCCEALRQAGWRNYSLFLADDGTLIGYLECEDFAAAQARHGGNRGQCPLAGGDGRVLQRADGQRPDEGIRADEIFHLN